LLTREIKKTGVKYGIGIDCVTGLELELDKFPQKYKLIGNGPIEIKTIITNQPK